MNARNAEFQQQLQEKDDEINRLQNELRKVQRGVIHIVSMCIRQQNESTLKYDWNKAADKFTSDLMVLRFQHDLAPCAAANKLYKCRLLKKQVLHLTIYGMEL